MICRTRAAAPLFGVILTGLGAFPAYAAGSDVHVSLWDKGEASMTMMDEVQPMGMAMPGSDMSMATMGITIDMVDVPAGEVTFLVTNDSEGMIHEMVLAPVVDTATELPYDGHLMKVDEDAAGHLAEVAERDPGKTGSLTMTLDPGTFILYCNIPGHYAMGMWTLLTVSG